VPAPLLLALAAVVASAVAGPGRPGHVAGAGADRLSVVWWAALAGLAPVIGTVAVVLLHSGARAGTGVLTELGLAGHTAGWAALASGALAAAVLGREAKARADAGLAGLAVAVLVAGIGPAAVAADLPARPRPPPLPARSVPAQPAPAPPRRAGSRGR